MTNWLLAYVLAGMVHYLKLVRAASILEGDIGVIMRAGTRRPRIGTFAGVTLSWPVA